MHNSIDMMRLYHFCDVLRMARLPFMSNKILVLGATGNIGGHVVRALKARGADLVAGVNTQPIEGVESVPIDYADAQSVDRAMRGIDTLFLVLPSHPDVVQWGKNLIDAAKKNGVQHIVRSSGSFATVDSSLKIIEILRATDEDVKASGIDYTITGPQFFMQNFSTTYADDYKKGAIIQPVGDQRIGWVDLRDVGAVNAEILLEPGKYRGQTLAITGGETLSYAEVTAQLNAASGRDCKFISVSPEAAADAMRGMQFPPFVVELLVSLGGVTSEGYADQVTSTVREVTGKDPIRFETFITENEGSWK